MAFSLFTKVYAMVVNIGKALRKCGSAITRCDKLHGATPKTLEKWPANWACLTVTSLFFTWGCKLLDFGRAA